MNALWSAAMITALIGLMLGILLGAAEPAHPGPIAQPAYCVDLLASIDVDQVRRLTGPDCRPAALDYPRVPD